jgi:prevent-host-death family protein
MKTVSVRDLQIRVKECVDSAQSDRVIVTRHGRPAAVLIGVEGLDWEAVVMETSSGFWDMIQKRRRQSTVSMKTMRARLKKKK